MKNRYDVIFVVLIYKNINDIINLIPQVERIKLSHRIIMVDSYSSDECSRKLRKIANENNCDFLSMENKGYGAGNNCGIDYALKKYDFDYLVVCNADIDILKFPSTMPIEYKGKLIAPLISTINGKPQNPFWVKDDRLAETLMYKGFKYNKKLIAYFGFALYKIQRMLFLKKFKKDSYNNEVIMGAHGAFVIYSKEIFDKIGLPYDEHMFLFAEECLLAHILKNNGIQTIMTKDIQILHHEDGSMNVANIKQMEERRKSIMYYYEKLYLK
jgi:GT2 family glycosyltransferase